MGPYHGVVWGWCLRASVGTLAFILSEMGAMGSFGVGEDIADLVLIRPLWLAVCREQTVEGKGRSRELHEEAAAVVPAGDGDGAGDVIGFWRDLKESHGFAGCSGKMSFLFLLTSPPQASEGFHLPSPAWALRLAQTRGIRLQRLCAIWGNRWLSLGLSFPLIYWDKGTSSRLSLYLPTLG